ncbi:hypothetical protein GUJ93_ZPchr0001g32663 [Zizania palustris]|uniref:Uncharacterized protein n=1 Tax=Zizania palustris TaxID=103762 RepID=A0A8J5S7E4_ZIZPA|nr:hypothetical protein GUJ93_ZPchr0001g32663 [Zizania palustris]
MSTAIACSLPVCHSCRLAPYIVPWASPHLPVPRPAWPRCPGTPASLCCDWHGSTTLVDAAPSPHALLPCLSTPRPTWPRPSPSYPHGPSAPIDVASRPVTLPPYAVNSAALAPRCPTSLCRERCGPSALVSATPIASRPTLPCLPTPRPVQPWCPVARLPSRRRGAVKAHHWWRRSTMSSLTS